MKNKQISFFVLSLLLVSTAFSLPLSVFAEELTLPVHLTPKNDTSLTSLQWAKATWTKATTSASTTAVSYLFEVSDASTTSTSTSNYGVFTSRNSFISNQLTKPEIDTRGMPVGVWYWHVRAISNISSSTTAWTTPWKVTVKAPTKTTPESEVPEVDTGGADNDTSKFTDPQGGDSGDGEGGGIAAASIGALASCSVGAILSRLISSTVGAAIQELTGLISQVITSFIKDAGIQKVKEYSTGSSVTKVPIVATETNVELVKQKSELRKLTAKSTGTATYDTDSFFNGFISSISSISLDSIMFCVVNEILTYITQATVQWINSGFNGNPVFVQNPRALFQQVADRETANLANEIMGQVNQAKQKVVNGVAQGVANGIISVAEPLRQGAVRAVIGQGAGQVNTLSPQLSQNYNAFVSGQKWMGFGALMEVSNNNYYETNLRVVRERERRIAIEQHNQELQLQYSNGYRTPTKCAEGHTRTDGSCDPAYTQTTIPYRGIGDEIQARSNMKYLRISFAKDFDSVVTALVNQLVKIAVNKVYEVAK